MSQFQNPNRFARTASFIAALSLGLSCGLAVAQADRTPATGKQIHTPATLKTSAHDARASKVIGKDVRDIQGKRIGEVQDLVVDISHDRIQYVVLSFGGVMGVGDKLFAFPLSSFRNPTTSDDLVLQVAKESLKKAPGFDRAKWPDFGDKTYSEQINAYFNTGTSTAPAIAPDQRLVRASKLIGKDINDTAGKDAGEIEDLVVDVTSAKVRYVVVDFDKAWSPDDKLLALPLKALTFPAKADADLVLNVPRDKLEMAKGFDEKAWPDINEAGWRQDMDRFLDNFPSAAGGDRERPADSSSSIAR
jgi:sporulation protein YlmC with PRC-barrel domain